MSNACDVCGWAAALCSMLAFGSFGVPIKSKVARSLDIDPLVFQSYKTTMVFCTCWLILLTGEEFTFTPWGIVSGMFWVPGGVATIFAVKNAGLAIAMGVLSSFIVLVSFSWGIFIFREHVHSIPGACLAVGCMMLGLLGMAYYSSPSQQQRPSGSEAYQEVELHEGDDGRRLVDRATTGSTDDDDDEEQGEEMSSRVPIVETVTSDDEDSQEGPTADELEDDGVVLVIDETPTSSNAPAPQDTHMILFGTKWSRFTLGCMSATFTGVYGGSIMVPMKWAPEDASGLGYLISFSIGATIVTLTLWLVRYLYLCQHYKSMSKAYYALPSFYIRKMWFYGGACGIMWSIGNFFSIIAVDYLGEGVGYSATQTAMLVSGLWGIFYFKEITGTETIFKWFLSASVTLVGIVLLSYEHHQQ